MHVVYANQRPPESWTSSIFLAGPTPREGRDIPAPISWRLEALDILKTIGYKGVVFVPETEDGTFKHDYDDQIEWEEMCLNFADVILFWIPRELTAMPGFTTNDEWGYWKKSDPMKLVLGTPPGAPKVKYQRYYAEKYSIPLVGSLEEACTLAYQKIQPIGIRRTGGEREVPLHIWHTPSFRQWYRALKQARNKLEGARVEWTFRVGPNKDTVFFWVLHVDIYIDAEDRHKSNEVVIGRPDISTILLYKKVADVLQSRLVLVKEFRSPVSNYVGFVLELAGGSSFKEVGDHLMIAAEECFEELGLRIRPNRFREHETRQLTATTLAHRAHLFSVCLTSEEMDEVVLTSDTVRGVEEDSERTQAVVTTYREVLTDNLVDWSMLGMIASVLHE